MSACIILYLEKQGKEQRLVYHKDLEREFNLSKATISQSISRMEKKKLIERKGDADDARIKWIILTDYARKIFERIKEC